MAICEKVLSMERQNIFPSFWLMFLILLLHSFITEARSFVIDLHCQGYNTSKKVSVLFYKKNNKKTKKKAITMLKAIRNYNPGHNILELYNILVQIHFTTSKAKLDI